MFRIMAIILLGAVWLPGVGAASDPPSDWIVFEKWLPDPSGESWGHSVEIWSVRPDGTDLRRLSSGAYDTGASWSPDRTRIAFSRSRVGIVVVRLEDLSSIELEVEHRAHHPVWLDDETIIYTAAAGPEDDFSKSWRLFSISLQERSPHLLDTGDLQGVFSPTISRSREFLAFRAWEKERPKIFVVEIQDLAGTRKPILAKDAYPLVWAPDDAALVALHGRTCSTVTLSGRSRRSFPDVQECKLSWSPSGEYVVFLQNAEIWVMNSNGEDRRLLTKPSDGSRYHSPVWW